MGDSLFSFRGLGSGERNMVSMLLVQALFLGIFIGAFDISAHSMFLAIFDEKMLAKGYIASGLTGMIMLSAYFFLQANMKIKNFGFFNLLIIGLITTALWLLLLNNTSNWKVFLVFVMLGPLNIVSVIGFRTVAGSVFSNVKGRRIFAIMDAALISGIILSCYSIPVILSVSFSLHNVLLISAMSVFVSAVIQGVTGAGPAGGEGTINSKPDGFKSNLSVRDIFREDSYTKTLGLFIILSVVSAFFIQYSFLAVTREKFPAAEDMARFLGIFTGSVMLLTLLGKFVLFSYLLKNYGLKICLTISPILLIFFSSLAVAFGMAMGYTRETASGFMIFFILLALIRFLSRSLDDSLESPTFRVLYQTIDEKLRFGVQSVIDSAVKEAGAFMAGLMLAGIGVLGFVRLIHFSGILIIILVAWLAVAFRLYSEYRKSIRKGVEKIRAEENDTLEAKGPVMFKSRFYGERAFILDYFNLITGNLSRFGEIDNKFYFEKIIDHASSEQDVALLPVIRKMTGREFEEVIRHRSAAIAKDLGNLSSEPITEDVKVISGRKILLETRMPQTTEILRLLRDKKVESKRLAIHMIGKFRLSDMLPEVCECLNIPGLEMDAEEVLRAFGSAAEEELMRFYLVSSGNINASKTILRLLSKLSLTESTGFLFSRLWSNSRQLKELALKCLIDGNFKPSPEDKERLTLLISDIVGIMAWSLSAKSCLEKNNDTVLLAEINKELNRWSRFLMDVLSVTYNAAALTRIRRNLEFDTPESVHYAHAIIDIIVDDSIKAKIVYLLDIIPDGEKLKNLNRFFPVGIPDYRKLLEDILNRDYNLISLWTKACVLRYLPSIDDSEMAESVVALLFSPEGLLQEEAARLIARSDLKLYRSVYNRIPVPTRRHLDKIISGETDPNELLFEKIQYLSGSFSGILEEELLALAKSMIFYGDLRKLNSAPADEYLMLFLSPGQQVSSGRIFYSSGRDDSGDKISGDMSSVYILPFRALNEFLYQYPESSDIVLACLEKMEVEDYGKC
jgi:ATP:ADP antiporter, AAA family